MAPTLVVADGIPLDDARAAVKNVPVRHYRLMPFDDIFPTKAWLSAKYKLGRDADDEQVIAAANMYVRLFRDVTAIVVEQRDWSLMDEFSGASCRFSIQALRKFVPDHQVWVVRPTGRIERAYYCG